MEIKKLIALFSVDITWLSIDERVELKIKPLKIVIPNELKKWKLKKPYTYFALATKHVTDIILPGKTFKYILRYEIKSKRHCILIQSCSGTNKLRVRKQFYQK